MYISNTSVLARFYDGRKLVKCKSTIQSLKHESVRLQQCRNKTFYRIVSIVSCGYTRVMLNHIIYLLLLILLLNVYTLNTVVVCTHCRTVFTPRLDGFFARVCMRWTMGNKIITLLQSHGTSDKTSLVYYIHDFFFI